MVFCTWFFLLLHGDCMIREDSSGTGRCLGHEKSARKQRASHLVSEMRGAFSDIRMKSSCLSALKIFSNQIILLWLSLSLLAFGSIVDPGLFSLLS